MTTGLLEARDVVLGYSGPVVGPLSFTLERGDVLGLWGPNGAGKSTVLRAVVDGPRLLSGSLVREQGIRVAYQPQHPVRLAHMPITGREFLRYMGAGQRPPPSWLAPALGQRIDRLSGGQFQLLCIWSRLAWGADLVLLDEPTNNLDPRATAALAEMLDHEAGSRAVLLVSHERAFLEQVSTHILEVKAWS